MNTMTTCQPPALYLLAGMRMWECFSFYGMRALLVLYMIQALDFPDSQAYGIFALYCALVEFGGLLGGHIADQYLGLRKTIMMGAAFILSGHLCLATEYSLFSFYCGLALIVVGSGLFSTNISALLGLFYLDDDQRREKGFTLFYMGINIGAFMSTLLCGYIGETCGWSYGFGLAAIGILIGNICFYCFQGVLEDKGLRTSTSTKESGFVFILIAIMASATLYILRNETFFMQIMPLVCIGALGGMFYKMWISQKFERPVIVKLAVLLFAFILFYAAEEQIGSSLIVYASRYVNESIAGIPITASLLLTLNPLIIIIGGTAITYSMIHIQPENKVVLALGLASLAFILLTFSAINEQTASGSIVIVGFALISFAEIFIGPAIYAFFSKSAPSGWNGAVMGIIPLGFSSASILGGHFSMAMAESIEVSDGTLANYLFSFGLIAAILLLGIFIVNVSIHYEKYRVYFRKRTA